MRATPSDETITHLGSYISTKILVFKSKYKQLSKIISVRSTVAVFTTSFSLSQVGSCMYTLLLKTEISLLQSSACTQLQMHVI